MSRTRLDAPQLLDAAVAKLRALAGVRSYVVQYRGYFFVALR